MPKKRDRPLKIETHFRAIPNRVVMDLMHNKNPEMSSDILRAFVEDVGRMAAMKIGPTEDHEPGNIENNYSMVLEWLRAGWQEGREAVDRALEVYKREQDPFREDGGNAAVAHEIAEAAIARAGKER